MFLLKEKVREQIENACRLPKQTFLFRALRGKKGFAQVKGGGTDSGFTLIELMVVVAIFVFMTALVVADYGSFNDGTLLTSMSYDVALALADAQSYGINTAGATVNGGQSFLFPYGMDFNTSSNGGNPSQMIFFADTNTNGICNNGSGGSCTSSQNTGDAIITTYTLARGGLIKCLYVSHNPITSSNSCSTSPNGNTSIIDITFKRPDPNAIITADDFATKYAYAQIQVEDASKTSTRSIIVNETGEIAVQNQ